MQAGIDAEMQRAEPWARSEAGPLQNGGGSAGGCPDLEGRDRKVGGRPRGGRVHAHNSVIAQCRRKHRYMVK